MSGLIGSTIRKAAGGDVNAPGIPVFGLGPIAPKSETKPKVEPTERKAQPSADGTSGMASGSPPAKRGVSAKYREARRVLLG